MAVAPFEQTCTACHLDQIVGKERVSGPKGIAFLALPGLDLRTLKEKNVPFGEWPDASETELTPFMKMVIGRDERGRNLIEIVDRLNLQDLTDASDDQLEAVANLVWQVKALFYALISGKASDVLADLNLGGGAKLSANLVADLTASIPRDVVISAQQQWLPNLGSEMANHRNMSDENETSWSTAVESTPSEEPPEPDESQESSTTNSDSAVDETASIAKLDPPVCTVRILGQCLVSKETDAKSEAAKAKATQRAAAGEEDDGRDDVGDDAASDDQSNGAPQGVVEQSTVANAKANDQVMLSADQLPQEKAADQTDDLLSLTDSEVREMEAAKNRARGHRPEAARGDAAAAAPAISIDADIDPESWAENGGWYRQDYAIFYRPTGHKDKFIYSWLALTGPQAPQGDRSPSAAIFDFLTSKDAQGSCTKCHSVDDLKSKGRFVNFSPISAESKQGRFTNFIHEPHFQAVGVGQRTRILENLGCLTCHTLAKGRPYLKSFEQGNPQTFVSNFGGVKKDLCQTCHSSSTSRQDCLLCHKYHVNGVITPMMETKIPIE
jgi:hypothetical protein